MPDATTPAAKMTQAAGPVPPPGDPRTAYLADARKALEANRSAMSNEEYVAAMRGLDIAYGAGTPKPAGMGDVRMNDERRIGEAAKLSAVFTPPPDVVDEAVNTAMGAKNGQKWEGEGGFVYSYAPETGSITILVDPTGRASGRTLTKGGAQQSAYEAILAEGQKRGAIPGAEVHKPPTVALSGTVPKTPVPETKPGQDSGPAFSPAGPAPARPEPVAAAPAAAPAPSTASKRTWADMVDRMKNAGTARAGQ